MDYKDIIHTINNNRIEGIEALYNKYADKFYGYAVDRWGFSEDEAWEIVYNTLDKLIDKIPDGIFQSQNEFDAYLFQVFKSFLSKGYRKKKRISKKVKLVSLEQSTEGFLTDKALQATGFSQEFLTTYFVEDTTENPLLDSFKNALSQLNPQDKDILLLKAQNYTYKEIASILKIKNKQLKVVHFRAKQRLIKLLKELKILER